MRGSKFKLGREDYKNVQTRNAENGLKTYLVVFTTLTFCYWLRDLRHIQIKRRRRF